MNRDEIDALRAVVEVRWVLDALLAIARRLKPLRALSRTLTRRAKAARAMREHSLSGQGRPQSVALSGGIAGAVDGRLLAARAGSLPVLPVTMHLSRSQRRLQAAAAVPAGARYRLAAEAAEVHKATLGAGSLEAAA